MHRSVNKKKTPLILLQHDAAPDGLDSLPERLKVEQCIHLQSGFLLLIEPTRKAYRQEDCKWKVTV